MLNSPLGEIEFVAIDTETTGGSTRFGHRVIEIGAVRFSLDGLGDAWSTPLWPHRPISRGAQRVHGLSAADLREAPCFPEVADDFLTFVGDAVVVMHNAPFDSRFLGLHLAEAGRRWRPVIVDTLRLLRRHFALPSNALGNAIRHFEIASIPTHRAVTDALATAELLRKIVEARAPGTLADLLAMQGKLYSIPPTELPRCDPRFDGLVGADRVVEIDYGERSQPLVGRIEGVAEGERRSYCTLRLLGGRRLHLCHDRIRRLRPVPSPAVEPG